MDNNEQKPTAQPCGPECACNSKKGLSKRSKAILLGIIIIVAGAVLGSSLLRKSRSVAATPQSGYSAVVSKKDDTAASFPVTQKSPVGETKPTMENISFAPLASLASLDTVARDLDGVFILLVNSETEKIPAMLQEIAAATNTIASHGMHMAAFQLNRKAPDFAAITSQLPAPGVLVIVKGRGMRGVQGSDITETKLLQAWLAATQPSGCCPAGSKRVCK